MTKLLNDNSVDCGTAFDRVGDKQGCAYVTWQVRNDGREGFIPDGKLNNTACKVEEGWKITNSSGCLLQPIKPSFHGVLFFFSSLCFCAGQLLDRDVSLHPFFFLIRFLYSYYGGIKTHSYQLAHDRMGRNDSCYQHVMGGI